MNNSAYLLKDIPCDSHRSCPIWHFDVNSSWWPSAVCGAIAFLAHLDQLELSAWRNMGKRVYYASDDVEGKARDLSCTRFCHLEVAISVSNW